MFSTTESGSDLILNPSLCNMFWSFERLRAHLLWLYFPFFSVFVVVVVVCSCHRLLFILNAGVEASKMQANRSSFLCAQAQASAHGCETCLFGKITNISIRNTTWIGIYGMEWIFSVWLWCTNEWIDSLYAHRRKDPCTPIENTLSYWRIQGDFGDSTCSMCVVQKYNWFNFIHKRIIEINIWIKIAFGYLSETRAN